MLVTDGELTDVIKIMSTDNPDSVLRAGIALNPGYDPCQNFYPTEVAERKRNSKYI